LRPRKERTFVGKTLKWLDTFCEEIKREYPKTDKLLRCGVPAEEIASGVEDLYIDLIVIIERAGPSTRKKFFEFFTVPIRNAHTRAAYYRAIQQFLTWSERAGYQDLEDIEPIAVAAYIETLQRHAAPPTVKQHMAAIRMMFSWLTEKGVLAMNPAREVKTESAETDEERASLWRCRGRPYRRRAR
jgi:hypothetical protein